MKVFQTKENEDDRIETEKRLLAVETTVKPSGQEGK